MARRLFVVLSQSPTSGLARRQLEEELVTQLIMEAGLEVNVVPHLADLPSDATGMLCLEGLSGNMVLLSWLADDEAWSHLERYGIQGRRGITRLADSESPRDATSSNGQRTIYLLNVTRHANAEHLLREIRRIRDDQAVQTVSIIGLGTSPLPVVNSPVPSPPTPPSRPGTMVSGGVTSELEAPEVEARELEETSSPTGAPSSPRPAGAKALTSDSPRKQAFPKPSSATPYETKEGWDEERREAELDRLVEQLDELDI